VFLSCQNAEVRIAASKFNSKYVRKNPKLKQKRDKYFKVLQYKKPTIFRQIKRFKKQEKLAPVENIPQLRQKVFEKDEIPDPVP
jgi:hypothetical protein